MTNHPIDEAAAPVLLTAETVAKWCECRRLSPHEAGHIADGMQAIATGRTVVVPVLTEAQAREAFQKWWAANDGTYVDAYLAGLRDAGLLIEDKP